MDKLARLAGYKNRASAASSFCAVRKKLSALKAEGDPNAGAAAAVTAPRNDRKRKARSLGNVKDNRPVPPAVSFPRTKSTTFECKPQRIRTAESDGAANVEDHREDDEYGGDAADRLMEEAAQFLETNAQVM